MKSTNHINNLVAMVIDMVVKILSIMLITALVVGKLGSVANGYCQLSSDFIGYVMILSIALNSMSSRFIIMSYYQNDLTDLNKYYNSLLYGNIFCATFLLLPLLFFTLYLNTFISIPLSMIFDVKIMFGLMFVNFILTLCFTSYGLATTVKNRLDLMAFRRIEGTILNLAVVCGLFYFFEPRLWYLSIGAIISNIYCCGKNVFYTYMLIPEVKLFHKEYISWGHLKKLLSSGLWNSFTRVSAILLAGLDLLIANQFISHLAMGILSISKILPKYILMGMGTFSSVFAPSVLIEYAKNDKASMISVINTSIKLNSLVSIIIEVGVIVFCSRLYALWLPNEDAVLLQQLTIIAMVGLVLLMPFEILWTVFTATNKVMLSSIYLFVEGFVTLVTVITCMCLIRDEMTKLFVVVGVSSFMEIIRSFVFLPLVSAKILYISKLTFYIPLLRVFVAFGLSLILSFIMHFLVPYNSWLTLFLLILFSSMCSFAICYLLIFNTDERIVILNKIIKRFSNA